jgi:hypothetical protein
MGIGPRPEEWSGPLESLGWEEFVVILPPSDPLRRGDGPVALAALRDREWVLFEREHALGQLVERLCAAEGFTPRATVRSAQIAGVAALAAVQFLRGRSARAVEDVLKARAGVRPLERLLTLGKDLRV